VRLLVFVLLAAFLATAAGSGAEQPQKLSFYPQAGILWQDLYIS